jgi:hypothetical protein
MKKTISLFLSVVALGSISHAQKGTFSVNMPCLPTLSGTYTDQGMIPSGEPQGEHYQGPDGAIMTSGAGGPNVWTFYDKTFKILATNPSAYDTYIPPATGWVAASGVGCAPTITGNAGITCKEKPVVTNGPDKIDFPTGTPSYSPITFNFFGDNTGYLTFSFSGATSMASTNGDGSAFLKNVNFGITTVKIVPKGICASFAPDTLKFDITRGKLDYYFKDADADGWGIIAPPYTDYIQAYGPTPPYLVANASDCNDNNKSIGRIIWYSDDDNDGLKGADSVESCTDPSVSRGKAYWISSHFKSNCLDASDGSASIGCYEPNQYFNFKLPNPYDTVSGNGIVAVNAPKFKPVVKTNSKGQIIFYDTQNWGNISSSDLSVATVDGAGFINVVGAGVTTIKMAQLEYLDTISYKEVYYTRTLTVDGFITSKATLPTTTTVFTNNTPTLNWPSIPGARNYCIKIYSDAALTNLLYTKCGLSSPSFEALIDNLGNITNARLEATYDYFYTVAGENTSGTGPYSSPAGSFKVDAVVTGSFDENMSSTFSIYPNPSNGTFSVSTTSELGNVSVFNSLGTMVYQNTTSSKQLNIELPSKEAGIYFVKVGNKMTKLIKE